MSNIIVSILEKNPCYTAGKTIRPRGLMLHSIGCPQPDAKKIYTNWNRPDYDGACVHAVIDGNAGDVHQTLPWNHRGWHCGGAGNDTHIGVEMGEPECIKYTSGSSFTCSDHNRAAQVVSRTYNSAVQLFAELCEQYGLDPLTDIISHAEGHARGIASNHGDPEHLWEGLGLSYTMDGFRKDVRDRIRKGVTRVSCEEFTLQVKKTVVRFGATGEDVRQLQILLNGYGYPDDDGQPLEVDSSAGPKTIQALVRYQETCGLDPDGVCGPATWANLLR